MIDKIRLAFGIVITIVIMCFFLFFLFDLPSEKEGKYHIKVPHGIEYRTNSYTTNGGCITFKDKHKNLITLCGNYTIIVK